MKRNADIGLFTKPSNLMFSNKYNQLCKILERCGGRVEGEKGAARLLSINTSKTDEKAGRPFGRSVKGLYHGRNIETRKRK
jgi:hypothetical protein